MEVPRDIQLEITVNQNQLKNAVRNHQVKFVLYIFINQYFSLKLDITEYYL